MCIEATATIRQSPLHYSTSIYDMSSTGARPNSPISECKWRVEDGVCCTVSVDRRRFGVDVEHWSLSITCNKDKRSPYLAAESRVPELIPVFGSQPAGDVSHKPGGRLPLLSARPAVTLATLTRAAANSAAWWTEARWVWTVCLRLLPDSVAAAIWTQAFCAWVQHANHSATEPPLPLVTK